MEKSLKPATLCVQAGWKPKNGDPRVLPIIQSTTFKYDNTEEMADLFDLKKEGYFYTRLQNPTNDAVASKIAALEGGVGAVLTSSGQAANFYAVFNICEAGDHIVTSNEIYGGTYNLFGAQALAKDFPEFLFHLRREVIAAQVVQVLKVLIDFVGIGKRAVNIVEVTDYQLRPIDEFVKFLSLVAHGLAIGVIEGKGHLNVGSYNGASQVGHQLVDGRDTRQQMRPGRAVAPVGSDQFLLQVVGEKLATAAVGKDKAVVLKAISPEVVTGDLLQKWSHNDNRFFISL